MREAQSGWVTKNRMIRWAYKWLPIICGCHCRDDRSFHLRGVKFPVCARCTGILLGWLAGAVLCFFVQFPALYLLIMLLPLLADGTVQRFTAYESGNFRRLLTGILFGYSSMSLFIKSIIAVFRLGLRIGGRLSG